MWVCHGRLTVDGKDYDGIGTHPALDEESPKAAESDSFKRAAVKVGVALHLYTDPHDNGNNVSARPSAGGKWAGPGRCPQCDAAAGFPHKSGYQCASV